MTKSYTIIQQTPNQSNFIYKNSSIITFILLLLTLTLLITTLTFTILWRKQIALSSNPYALHNGTIGFPPLLPNDGKYLQWTILHLNDVYEMLPLDQGRKGGLSRVARVRQLLTEENPHTFTILAGDFLSPSALSQAEVNGTALNGKQMILALNTLGLDFVTFGNHEFDLNETELIARINQSTFRWISSNVFQTGTNRSFSISIPYHLLTIDQLKILFIGLTIDVNQPYVRITNQTLLIPFVKDFLQSISDVKYDVLIALTHLDIATDIRLAENIPEIDLILGGHEHENYHLLRGSKLTPIHKADGNAFTVYIHRCAFNLQTKQLRIYSTLAPITGELEDEPKTSEVVNYWYNLGMEGFRKMGYDPEKVVSCLPEDIELDGRSASVRNDETLLTKYCCECLIESTKEDLSRIGLFNTGSIRIDDVLRGNISEYDMIRVLPFGNEILSISVPGKILVKILMDNLLLKGSGMFLSYCGIETTDGGQTWVINGSDISRSVLKYVVATNDYTKENSDLNGDEVIVLQKLNLTHTKSLINYFKNIFPSC